MRIIDCHCHVMPEEVLKDLRRQGVEKIRIVVSDDLPGLEEVIGKNFPQADW